MPVITIPKTLRDKLGEDATDALIEIIKKIDEDILSIKEDITSLKIEITEIKAEFKLLKWMMGVILAGVVSLVLKTFLIP